MSLARVSLSSRALTTLEPDQSARSETIFTLSWLSLRNGMACTLTMPMTVPSLGCSMGAAMRIFPVAEEPFRFSFRVAAWRESRESPMRPWSRSCVSGCSFSGGPCLALRTNFPPSIMYRVDSLTPR